MVVCTRAGIFDCKPLPVLWAKFPEYNHENTIMCEFSDGIRLI